MTDHEPRATTSPLAFTDRDLQEGQKVGEYVVEAKIGEGGFGTVFRASHPLIGKVAAVKVLNRQYSADPEMVSRFVAEARAVNQIRHRNIIDIFAFGQIEDGRSYYVMEYLEGMPLDEHLERSGSVPLGDAIPILRAVARALDAAHAKGIAHRDLKPENIFLARESDGALYPKLLDFGIAKLLGTAGAGVAMHKTRTGAPIGTPYYMSPEQCRGRDVDHRTDIYAFGVVAYKLLTGVVPFEGEDYMDILLKQIGEEPIPPSQREPLTTDSSQRAPLPVAVDDAIAWMMKKDPAARPPNLITAMRALEESASAAGVDFVTDQPTGLHASQTSRVSVQRTPSAITPLPRRPTTTTPNPRGAIGGAATVDATSLSVAMDGGRADTMDARTPSVTLDGNPKRSPVMLIVALVGAIAVGAVVFLVIRSKKEPPAASDGSGESASKRNAGDGSGTEPRNGNGSGTGSSQPAGSGSGPETLARLVDITIEGPPEGTEVYGPRGLLGVVPGIVQLERGEQDVVLTFKADGFKAASRPVKPLEDQTVQVVLEPTKAAVVEVGAGSGSAKDGKGKDGKGKDGKGKDGKGKDGKGKDGKGGGSGSATGAGSGSGKKDGGGGGSGSGSGRDTLEDPFGNKTK